MQCVRRVWKERYEPPIHLSCFGDMSVFLGGRLLGSMETTVSKVTIPTGDLLSIPPISWMLHRRPRKSQVLASLVEHGAHLTWLANTVDWPLPLATP